ncbi:hypothetical protein VTJ83DRAFT_1176 [Remersonia thermophila]|uniref:Vacuolar ATPase assembly protein VMA22 n=1 Tax=Remersonia thermophila TaxID=72144 RepID=A0ABR4DN92_9PEZI
MSALADLASTEVIDALLERYLTLLDEYTSFRSQLNALQASMYQCIARANFAAERGVRYYGQDYYDERMQAGRHVHIRLVCAGSEQEAKTKEGETEMETRMIEAAPVFSVRACPDGTARSTDGGTEEEKAQDSTPSKRLPEGGNDGANAAGSAAPSTSPDDGNIPPQGKGPQKASQDRVPAEAKPHVQEKQQETGDKPPDGQQKQQQQQRKKKMANKHDPLRWFGILTPLPLRQAQSHAIRAVEDLIPRLASISAEMAAVELAVRRARKKRAKEERRLQREEKQQQQQQEEEEKEQLAVQDQETEKGAEEGEEEKGNDGSETRA